MRLKLINDNVLNVEIPKCRLLLTDIPYDEVSRKDSGLRNLDKSKADIETFELTPFLDHIYESADIFLIFCGNGQFSTIHTYFSELQEQNKGTVRPFVWCKTNPSPMNAEYVYMSSIEFAIWFKKRGTGKLTEKCKPNYVLAPTGSSKIHPTEKNHKLLESIILQNTSENDLIVDTCMGSGSTGLVALKNNRRFFGIELDKEYFEICQERLGEL